MTVQAEGVPVEGVLARARRRQARPVARLLVLSWVVLVGSAWLLGERTGSYDRLVAEVAAGEVRRVQVAGGLPEGSKGYATVDLRWRSGWHTYDATVVEASSERALRDHEGRPSDALVGVGVEEQLTALRPGLEVERTDWIHGNHGFVYQWRVPTWTVFAVLLHLLLTFGLVLNGPPPRRATRAAWGWLVVLAAPVGIPAYLLLSGVTGWFVPTQRDRPLTGGWAFLLACWLSAVLASPGG